MIKLCGFAESSDWQLTKKDENCFVFSLLNKERNPIKIESNRGEIAICCYKNYGPTFGSGHDICIVGNANEKPKKPIKENKS